MLPAYVTGMVNQELLLQNEYLAAENQALRAQLPKRLPLTDPERSTLAEIGKRLGRKALAQVACVARPDTILGWYHRLVDGPALSAGPMYEWRVTRPEWNPAGRRASHFPVAYLRPNFRVADQPAVIRFRVSFEAEGSGAGREVRAHLRPGRSPAERRSVRNGWADTFGILA
jgi:hypothetical protein